MAYFRPVRWLVNPLFELFRYIPPIAWAPFAMFWFGGGSAAQAYVIFTSAFPPILINTFRGVQLVDRSLIDAARTLGAKPLTVLAEVAMPGTQTGVPMTYMYQNRQFVLMAVGGQPAGQLVAFALPAAGGPGGGRGNRGGGRGAGPAPAPGGRGQGAAPDGAN